MVICEKGDVSIDEHVPHPVEDEPPIILGETDIGDEAYGSVHSVAGKLLRKAMELLDYHDWQLGVRKGQPRMEFGTVKNEEIPEFGGGGRTLLATDHEGPPEPKRPWDEVHYSSPPRVVHLEAQEATAANKVGGFHGYEYLPGPPDIGSGNSASTWGMQGGLMLLMFAVCYMLYMILKKRVCSFHIGWQDNDAGAELELGGSREA